MSMTTLDGLRALHSHSDPLRKLVALTFPVSPEFHAWIYDKYPDRYEKLVIDGRIAPTVRGISKYHLLSKWRNSDKAGFDATRDRALRELLPVITASGLPPVWLANLAATKTVKPAELRNAEQAISKLTDSSLEPYRELGLELRDKFNDPFDSGLLKTKAKASVGAGTGTRFAFEIDEIAYKVPERFDDKGRVAEWRGYKHQSVHAAAEDRAVTPVEFARLRKLAPGGRFWFVFGNDGKPYFATDRKPTRPLFVKGAKSPDLAELCGHDRDDYIDGFIV